jgi:hypothetical protein
VPVNLPQNIPGRHRGGNLGRFNQKPAGALRAEPQGWGWKWLGTPSAELRAAS